MVTSCLGGWMGGGCEIEGPLLKQLPVDVRRRAGGIRDEWAWRCGEWSPGNGDERSRVGVSAVRGEWTGGPSGVGKRPS